MDESVIYVLRSGNRILCEWRDLNGALQNCIPGGTIEQCDRQQEDYVLAAASREATEELGITLDNCQELDEFVSNGVRFHVVVTDRWAGDIPVVNRDNQNELHWVSLDALIHAIALEPLRRIIAELESTEPSVPGGMLRG
jgi:8-oxo-dGTP pyrophosphatase MutT (NUDIX family)